MDSDHVGRTVRTAAGGMRVALYGHDTCGLGHVRRNLELAAAIAARPEAPDALVVTGAAEAGRFPRPPGVELLVLPAIDKRQDGTYAPATWSCDLDDALRLRTSVLTAALVAWAPDLLIVDKVPLGFRGELAPALHHLHTSTRTVLGLREVLDDAVTARREWREGRCTDTVRDLYDEVWIYGDPRVHDLAVDLALPPAVRIRTRYLGYLARGRQGAARRPPCAPAGRDFVLGMVGGGSDGGHVARSFAAAPMPVATTGVLLTGPYLPESERAVLDRAAAARDDLVVVPFTDEASGWIHGARAVVTMGGYNSVAEVLATDTPALVVPRTTPRCEQAVRAGSLRAVGAVASCLPADLDAERLGRWLADVVPGDRVDRSHLDLDGLTAVRRRAGELLLGPTAPWRTPTRAHLEVAREAV